jgi:hypothetical protein
MGWLKDNWHRLIVHAAGIFPLFTFAADYLQNDSLVNRTLILRAGTLGLIFLVASFACTPISIVFGWNKATRFRRSLGLYGVLYITIHLFIYAVLDNALDFDLIVRDIGERRSMLVGLAFCCCYPWQRPRRAAGSGVWGSAGGFCTGWCTWRCRWQSCTICGWIATLSICRWSTLPSSGYC